MQPIATDEAAWSVCLSVMIMIAEKMAEPINVPFGKGQNPLRYPAIANQLVG